MAGQSTESTAYNKRQRTRLEAGPGVVMIQQCDTKRMIAVDPNSRTYSVLPLDVPAPEPAARSAAPATEAQGDKVLHKVTLTDTAETRTIFGRTARHIKTVTLTEPGPQACGRKKMKIDTDGWYIDGEQPSACSVGGPEPRESGFHPRSTLDTATPSPTPSPA